MREVTMFLHTQKIPQRPAVLRQACATARVAVRHALRRIISRLHGHGGQSTELF